MPNDAETHACHPRTPAAAPPHQHRRRHADTAHANTQTDTRRITATYSPRCPGHRAETHAHPRTHAAAPAQHTEQQQRRRQQQQQRGGTTAVAATTIRHQCAALSSAYTATTPRTCKKRTHHLHIRTPPHCTAPPHVPRPSPSSQPTREPCTARGTQRGTQEQPRRSASSAQPSAAPTPPPRCSCAGAAGRGTTGAPWGGGSALPHLPCDGFSAAACAAPRCRAPRTAHSAAEERVTSALRTA